MTDNRESAVVFDIACAVAHEAIRREYGADTWEEHRHSKFEDDLGRPIGDFDPEHHDICPWPSIDHVVSIIVHALLTELPDSGGDGVS